LEGHSESKVHVKEGQKEMDNKAVEAIQINPSWKAEKGPQGRRVSQIFGKKLIKNTKKPVSFAETVVPC